VERPDSIDEGDRIDGLQQVRGHPPSRVGITDDEYGRWAFCPQGSNSFLDRAGVCRFDDAGGGDRIELIHFEFPNGR